jgi:DNA-binding NtrC family response regulator
MSPVLPQATVLCVDDEPRFHETLDRALQGTDYRRVAAYNVFQARDILHHDAVDVVLLDLGLPGARGDELLGELGGAIQSGRLEVLMLTGEASYSMAVRCAQAGAFDYVTKSAELFRDLPLLIRRALEHRVKRRAALAARTERATHDVIAQLIRSSVPNVHDVVTRLHQAAGTRAPVLVATDDTTLSEPLAHFVHLQSPRADGPFVTVDLSRLSSADADAVVAAGPNPQALSDVELADGGSLFLAGVDRLSERGASALVRLLAAGELPAAPGRRIDVRLIASVPAASRAAVVPELAALCADGWLDVPGLAQRRADIPMLLEWVAGCRLPPHERPRYSGEALTALKGYSWPGQLGELTDVVLQLGAQRLVQPVALRDLPFAIAVEYYAARAGMTSIEGRSPYREAVRQFHRVLFTRTLRAHHGDRRAAARSLGIPFPSFVRKLRQLGEDER